MCPALFVRILALVIFSSLVACGGGGSSGGGVGAENSLPVADAGDHQHVKVGALVHLDASASVDADGDEITYAWTILQTPAGSAAALSDTRSVKPSFTVDVVGVYVIQLIVNDGTDNSLAVTTQVTAEVENSKPVAKVGVDRTTHPNVSIQLDGSASSDADGDLLSYAWVQTGGPNTAVLTNANTVAPSFVAVEEGEYTIRLVVNDGYVDSDPTYMVVTVVTANIPPVAYAGAHQNVTEGDTVTLDGSGSSDADGDLITYAWSFVSKPEGSNAVLTGSDTVSPIFTADIKGTYVIGLVVNDGSVDSESVNVVVGVSEVKVPPTAIINDGDLLTIVGAYVGRSGKGVDANGKAVGGLKWTLVSRPEGSQATLSLNSQDSSYFRITPDVPGTYVVSLVVGQTAPFSEPAFITITAQGDNLPPIADAGENQFVKVGGDVQLDGSGSSDPDGDTLSYLWTLRSRPANSNAVIVDPASVSPYITPDQAGEYVVELIVSDGQEDSVADTVTIKAVDQANGLRLEVYEDSIIGEGKWKDLPMPYTSNGQISRSAVCSGACPTDKIALHTYRLTAIGGDYTIDDVSAVVIGASGDEFLPEIDGLFTGQFIQEGATVEFSLAVERIQISNVDVQFSFDVIETGKHFEVNRTVTLQ